MRLKCVKQLSLPDVKDAHVAFPTSGDEELLFGCVLQHGGSMIMAREP